jgi:hypothetical protein
MPDSAVRDDIAPVVEKLGLAWDVVRVSPERQAAKAAAPA